MCHPDNALWDAPWQRLLSFSLDQSNLAADFEPWRSLRVFCASRILGLRRCELAEKKSRSFGLYEPWVSVHEHVVHCQLPSPALPGPSGLVVAAFQEHPVFRTALIIDTRINSFWDSFGLCVGKISGQISGNSLSHKARHRHIRHINANVFVVFRQFNLPEVRARENLRVRHRPGRWFGVTH